MLKCRQATDLLSEALDRQLGLRERAGLRLHLATCRGCRAYRQQLDFLRQACRGWVRREESDSDGST